MLRFAAAGSDATCGPQLKNTSQAPVIKDPSLCVPQKEGTYTLAMYYVSNWDVYFYIMDHECNTLSSYDVPNDCIAPFRIEENFLDYVLNIESGWFQSDPVNLGEIGFQFKYGSADYWSGDSGTGCSCSTAPGQSVGGHTNVAIPSVGGGEEPAAGCKCPFPVKGAPSKRTISFNA